MFEASMLDDTVGLERKPRRSGGNAGLGPIEQRLPFSLPRCAKPRKPALRIRRLIGRAGKYRLELVRLLALSATDGRLGECIGLGPDEWTARRFERLWEPGGTLLVAERGARLVGLVQLVPELMASAFLGHYVWTVQSLATDPNGRQTIARALMAAAAKALDAQADFIAAMVPACEAETIRGIERAGFRPACGEAVAVIDPRTTALARPPSIAIEALAEGHLGQIAALARCGACYSHFAWDPRIDRDRVHELSQRLLLLALRETGAGALVAKNGAGEAVGVARFTIAHGTQAGGKKTASLDLVGVRSDQRGRGITQALHTHALGTLEAKGVGFVTTRAMIKDEASLLRLKTLKKIGYRLVTSNLVLHRWASDRL